MQPGETAGLRADSEAALAIAPEMTVARFNLGLALLLASESERALREYRRAAKEETEISNIRREREYLEREVPGPASGRGGVISLLRAREAELDGMAGA